MNPVVQLQYKCRCMFSRKRWGMQGHATNCQLLSASLCSTVSESCARCAVVLHRQSALSAHSFHRLISVDSWPHTSNLSPFQRRLLKNCTYPRVYWCHDNLFSRLSQDLWWIKSSWLARLKNEMVVRKRETCILSSIQVQPAALGSGTQSSPSFTKSTFFVSGLPSKC